MAIIRIILILVMLMHHIKIFNFQSYFDVAYTKMHGMRTSFVEQIKWRQVFYTLDHYTKKIKSLKCNKKMPAEVIILFPNFVFSHPSFQKCFQEKNLSLCIQRLHRILKKEWSSQPHWEWAHEYSIVLFSLYKRIFEMNMHCAINRSETILFRNFSVQTFWLYLIAVNNQLQTLPLESILGIIDLLSDAIPAFFEYYTDGTATGWKKWIKNNWWMIALATVTVCLRLLIIIRHYEWEKERLNDLKDISGQ
jgi:hypothetical protein